MKAGACFLVALSIILFGVYDCIKFKKNTRITEEILSLLELFKNEINYRKASYSELLQAGEKQGFRYISFQNGKICLSCDNEHTVSKEFSHFTEKIGTTDAQGQVALCEEFTEKLRYILSKQRAVEDSKLQVNLALSFLGAISVIIIFI